MPDTSVSVAAQPTATPSGDEAELRRIAVQLAETAAAHVRARRPEVFGPDGARAGAVQAKGHPTDPVTIVDTETEDLIRRLLGESRPGDPILGEEGGGSLGGGDAETVHWVVDPIDGTVNFLYGIPGYAISVAAVRGGRPVAGAVVDVAHAATYSAALGLGATRVGADGAVQHLRCTPVRSASMALVGTGFAYGTHRRTRQAALVAELLPHIRDIRRLGAAALDLCFVAEGRIDAYYEHGLNAWDWAAGALIAAEAGALLTLPPATALGAAGDLVVAAAPGIADELGELLRRVGATESIEDR
ncbi:inositol monophosphatase [Nocardia sp. NBC_00565]|uniref:inositol monophosphatase family protein n=1 Tax=Nocardia sp. NBC_00565 TaxID=2975993 RepID=UPI002E82230D|nr:inositol monophosphatase family protein [Nocardia sp. NBC_00565]WUC07310.1 inositol monophosphatase [Nocardia sp. NBC_00565]